jgi:hypothetical protein
MKKLFVAVLFIVAGQAASSQCFKGNRAFKEGEYIAYEVSYSWGPIWVNAGTVNFAIEQANHSGKTTWHLKSTGSTYKSYDFFFKVNDYYDAWIDPVTFTPYEFRRTVNEGGYKLINSMRYDHNQKKIFSSTKTNNNPVRYDTINYDACVFNPVTAVYVARTLDISGLKRDARIPVTVLIDDSTYSIYIRYLGKEVVQNRDGQSFRCIKFSAKMVEGTIFRGDEDVLVWVTDDENKVPVYIEAKILVGSVKAYLTEMRGLRNPVTSVVGK